MLKALALVCVLTVSPFRPLHSEPVRTPEAALVARFQRRAAESFDTERLLKVRECQRQMMEATDAILVVYEQEFPRWRRDGQGSVIFQRPAAVPLIQRWVAQLKGSSEECAAVQRELIDRSKARVAQP